MIFKRKKPEYKHYYSIPFNDAITETELYKMVNNSEWIKDKLVVNLGGFDFLNIRTAPNILISGSVGSGKSVCIESMLYQLLLKNSPQDLELYIIDPKKVDYIQFKQIPHCKAYGTETSDALNILKQLESIMYFRYEIMQRQNAKKIENVNGSFSQILLVFDEIATFLDNKSKREILPTLNNLARLSRASGIHIICGTQRPTTDIVNGQIKSNMPTRISFRLPSAVDSRIILDMSGAETLSGCGHGIIKRSDGSSAFFQGYMTPNNQAETIINWWKNQPLCYRIN